MRIKKLPGERNTGMDKSKKTTKTDAEKGTHSKRKNKTGLVTASLRHRGFCFELMMGGARGKNDEDFH
jgi:hypothetical protein